MEPQGYMGYEGIMLMVEMTKAPGSEDDDIFWWCQIDAEVNWESGVKMQWQHNLWYIDLHINTFKIHKDALSHG